jgi:hypothetical protein
VHFDIAHGKIRPPGGRITSVGICFDDHTAATHIRYFNMVYLYIGAELPEAHGHAATIDLNTEGVVRIAGARNTNIGAVLELKYITPVTVSYVLTVALIGDNDRLLAGAMQVTENIAALTDVISQANGIAWLKSDALVSAGYIPVAKA